MLQCGGTTNVSVALLKEVFHRERRYEDRMAQQIKQRAQRQATARCHTAHGPRRGPRSYLSGALVDRRRRGGGGPATPRVYELPHQGIGYHIPPAAPTKDTVVVCPSLKPAPLSHGRQAQLLAAQKQLAQLQQQKQAKSPAQGALRHRRSL